MSDEETLEFWKSMALGLKDEMVARGNLIEELECEIGRLVGIEVDNERLVKRNAELAAPQWEPVSQSLEYDLITHAIQHGEIPQGYRIYRSKEPAP